MPEQNQLKQKNKQLLQNQIQQQQKYAKTKNIYNWNKQQMQQKRKSNATMLNNMYNNDKKKTKSNNKCHKNLTQYNKQIWKKG